MHFRALFFGTPAFAVPSLDALAEVADIAAVVCQPDKPVGRGLVLTPPPVKLRALARNLPVVQPTKLKTGEFAGWVRAQQADVALVVAYGRILPKDVVFGPRLGCVNVHASLLPRYRGAAPITWAIVRGEGESGITLMVLDEGMDTGPMLAAFPTPIGQDETAGELSERLAQLGADAVRMALPRYVAGECTLVAQDPSAASYAPMLRKEDGKIAWDMPARRIHDHVRGMNPWPGATCTLHGKPLKLHRTRVSAASRAGAVPGDVIMADKVHLLVACAEGAVELVSVQPEGKRVMRGTDLVIGRGVREGDRLG